MPNACWNEDCVEYGNPQPDAKVCEECKTPLTAKPLVKQWERDRYGTGE